MLPYVWMFSYFLFVPPGAYIVCVCRPRFFPWSDPPDLVRSTSVPRAHVLADEPMVLKISLEGSILVSRLLRQGGFL